MSPFEDLTSATQANRTRDYYISLKEAQRVLDACPDAQWRLLFALSCFGGLRCPSEHLGLRWDDIDWERDRFTVRSPKTEHHPGGESRIVPLFPELRPVAVGCDSVFTFQRTIPRIRYARSSHSRPFHLSSIPPTFQFCDFLFAF